ncbi:MAG: helix-turn-helix transcriptional regulator [Geitlerinemataceae cyanobacterium]
MLHVYFKQTMDRFGIKGGKLAEAFGCSRNHISEIRMGKCSPPIKRLWEILETMEELAPGAKEYFGSLVAGHDSTYVLRLAEMMADKNRRLDTLSDQELGQLLVDIGNEMSKRFAQKSSKNAVVGIPA